MQVKRDTETNSNGYTAVPAELVHTGRAGREQEDREKVDRVAGEDEDHDARRALPGADGFKEEKRPGRERHVERARRHLGNSMIAQCFGTPKKHVKLLPSWSLHAAAVTGSAF